MIEALIDCVIVNDAQREIRYVVPTRLKGETAPFCHLRLDYLDLDGIHMVKRLRQSYILGNGSIS
jgi:hypothetical protein